MAGGSSDRAGSLFFVVLSRSQQDNSTGARADRLPGDGVVTEAEWIETISGSRLRLSIFLNVFDVHVNRSPVGGIVKVCEFRKGQFMNAMNPESVLNNEQTLITIDAGGYEVSFKQIAGLLARRIVCNLKVGGPGGAWTADRPHQVWIAGRTCCVPAEANLKVKTGARVKGGSTVLAVLPEALLQGKSAVMAVVA